MQAHPSDALSAQTPPPSALDQPCPPGWQAHAVRVPFAVRHPLPDVWAWLNRPETFSRGQVWPFFVEFFTPGPHAQPAGFAPGVFTLHHGPWLNANALITQVDPPRYRELVYLYGSYVLSPKAIRPTRLRFWLEADGPDATRVVLQLDSYVRPWVAGLYGWGQRRFWANFARLATRQVGQMKRQNARP